MTSRPSQQKKQTRTNLSGHGIDLNEFLYGKDGKPEIREVLPEELDMLIDLDGKIPSNIKVIYTDDEDEFINSDEYLEMMEEMERSYYNDF